MKKVIALFLVLVLALTFVVVPAAAKDKPADLSLLKNLLEEKYKGIETCIDYTVLEFNISQVGDTCTIEAVSNYYLFNKIQHENYRVEAQKKAVEQIQNHMKALAEEVTKLKPKIKFKGYIFATYTNMHLEQRTFQTCTWTSQNGVVEWQTDQDEKWIFGEPDPDYIIEVKIE